MWTVPAGINPQNISPMCQETALYTWKVTHSTQSRDVRTCTGLPAGCRTVAAPAVRQHTVASIKVAAANLLPSTHSIEQRARELKSYMRQPASLGTGTSFLEGSGNGSESQRCHLAQLCSLSGAQGTPKRYSS